METAVNIPSAEKRAPKSVNARTFATGSGVTAALIAAAVLAFASVAAYVGIRGHALRLRRWLGVHGLAELGRPAGGRAGGRAHR